MFSHLFITNTLFIIMKKSLAITDSNKRVNYMSDYRSTKIRDLLFIRSHIRKIY